MKVKKNRWLWMILMIMLWTAAFTGTVSAKGLTLDYKSNSGWDFGEASYAYYKVDVEFNDYLIVLGVYGFATQSEYSDYIYSCSNWRYDDGKATWQKRYPYRLLDKNKKPIDPVGWHKAGKGEYRYGYFLKKGTYYLQIKTGKKACGYYLIKSYLISDHTNADSSSYKNGGGKKKAKAVKIKSPDRAGYTSHSQILYYGWHGNYISFPLQGSGKDAQSWYKYYSDGKSPLYVVVRLGMSSHKWDMVVYGPSFPKGRTVHLPEKSKVDKYGSNHFYKNGKEVRWGNVVTLERSNGRNSIGPKPGWYYFKFVKRKVSGKKDSYYKKFSFCGDIYITKKKSLVY